MTNKEAAILRDAAREARGYAYAPYSAFTVGAALLAEDGRVFCGCNVENAAYSPTLCAERVAIGAAIAAGVRRFRAIAVVGGHGEEEACTPCGVCRQTLAEFSDGTLTVLFRDEEGERALPLSELLPYGFSLKR